MSLRGQASVGLLLIVFTQPSPLWPASLAVDPTASRITIHLDRTGLAGFLGHRHTIAAPLEKGRVEVDEQDPTRSTVQLTFEGRRLAIVPGTEPASDVPTVEARMRGPEVLDVERFPRVAFVSSAVVSVQTGGASGRLHLRVHGRLELKGKSFEVDLPIEVQRDGAGLTATGEAWLELRALGIEPPSVGGVVKVANRFRLSYQIVARP